MWFIAIIIIIVLLVIIAHIDDKVEDFFLSIRPILYYLENNIYLVCAIGCFALAIFIALRLMYKKQYISEKPNKPIEKTKGYDYSTEEDSSQMKMDDGEKKAYKILGVPPKATDEEIKEMRNKLIELWHPDKGKAENDSEIKDINWAYEYVMKKRRERNGNNRTRQDISPNKNS